MNSSTFIGNIQRNMVETSREVNVIEFYASHPTIVCRERRCTFTKDEVGHFIPNPCLCNLDRAKGVRWHGDEPVKRLDAQQCKWYSGIA